MKLNLYSIAYPVTALGPGQRVALWLAGCRKECEGCLSPEMQDREAGREIEIHTVMDRFTSIQHRINGLTVSGGEPLDQPEALQAFLKVVTTKWPEWDVIVYTGYTWENMADTGIDIANILQYVDVLIDGEYRRDIPQDHPLAGSGNQRVLLLTERGRERMARLDVKRYGVLNYGIGKDNRNMIVGVPASMPGGACA